MAVALETVVKQLEDSGIVSSGKLEDFVPPKAHPKTVEELVAELVKADHLTKFQAQHVAAGKTKSLILGNYTVLDKIGAGGMGQVFKAEHRRMKRVVAIKMLPPAVTKDAAAAARFQREVEAAAKLSHSNIVAAYDADEANGAHFLVMEYVEGKDLSALVKKDGPFPVAQALDYILQAAKGLEFAHSEGVVHRDVKPANLLLDKKGAVKILDMGLARMRDPLADPNAPPGADLTHSGSIMGTIDYMAPEQAMDSRQADARGDIYSLGCTLHYLLTGRPPYGGDTVLKRLTGHQQAAIPLLSSLRPDIPPGMDEVFGRMMAKRPPARFQTAKELIAALESLRNQPASARPVPVAAQPIAVQPVAAAPATPAPSGIHNLESMTLPGSESRSRKARKSNSKVPLAAAIVVLLLTAAGAGAWLMSGHKLEEIAQSEPALKAEVQQPAVDRPPAAVDESKPSAASPKELPSAAVPLDTPQPVTPPAVMPPKVEPTVIAVRQIASPVAAPVLPEAAANKADPPSPPVARPAVAVALAPMATEQPAATDGKLPIPAAEGQRESLKLVKELYKDDYAQAKQPEAKAALAEKLLNESQQTKDDATALYVVLREARDLAVEAADPALAERAIGMLAGRYAIEPLPELTAVLEEMTGKPHPADANRAITEAALGRVEEAQATNDFELAKRLVDVALVAARKSKDSGLSKRAIEVGKVVSAARQQWDGWHKAQATLSQTPDDPAANLAVGRYLCIVQGDWEQGLSHLAKGPDGPLKDLATKSLKPPAEAAALAELGDTWFGAAEKAKAKDKAEMRAGAAYWYTQAEPGLTGLVKTIVEKRLKELGGPITVAPSAHAGKLPEAIELPIAPGATMKFRLIQPGTFTMGTPNNTGTGNEATHQVNITRPYYFGVTEVTQAQWLGLIDHNPSAFPGDPQCPVEKMSLPDCQQFLDRLNQTLGAVTYRFRLPTEAEWEYACRAGTTTTFFFGDGSASLSDYGWTSQNSGGHPHPVGQLKPNPWGLYDMCGNVFEWCSDWFDTTYYSQSPADDPQGPSSGNAHVVRGGAFSSPASACRSAARNARLAANPFGLRIVAEPKFGSRAAVAVGRVPLGSTKPNPRSSPSSGPRPLAFNQVEIDRNLALWALSLGAKVDTVVPNEPMRTLADASELPAQAFVLKGINFAKCAKLTDADLAKLAPAQRLRGLTLSDTAITDAGMIHVAALRQLDYFQAYGAAIGDEGFAELRGLPLTSLLIGASKITDAGLENIPLSVTNLSVGDTQVTGTGFAKIARLQQLETISLQELKFTEADLLPLMTLPNLATLYLANSSISDAGLQTIGRIATLKLLRLNDTKVTDAGLKHLANLHNLTRLELRNTKVTAAGVEWLKQQLPQCAIFR